MPRPCTTCKHPDRDAIEAAVNSGTSFRNIERQFQVSASSIFRHKTHAPESPKAPATESGAILPSPELTLKMRKFGLAYIGEANGNGTEAARLAGYQGNDVTLAAVASENLRKPQIQAFITQLRASAEKAASGKILTGIETLVGISRIAESDVADLFPDSVLLREAQQRGVSQLIKTIHFDKTSGSPVKLELYSAQTAYQDLAKHHRLLGGEKETETPQTRQQLENLTAMVRELMDKYALTHDQSQTIVDDVWRDSADITSDAVS